MVNIMQNCMRMSIIILLTCTLTYTFTSAQQAKDRVLVQLPFEPGRQTPVEITAIEVKGKVVEPGRKFSSGDDWLRGLTFTLKNISDKPVSYIEVGLHFLAPAGSQAQNAVYDLRYGYLRVIPNPAADMSAPKSLMPGETWRLELSEADYQNLAGLRAYGGQSSDVETV